MYREHYQEKSKDLQIEYMQLQKSGDNAKMMELQQKAQALGAEYSTSVENLMNLADSRAAQACESEVIPATELIPATPVEEIAEEDSDGAAMWHCSSRCSATLTKNHGSCGTREPQNR